MQWLPTNDCINTFTCWLCMIEVKFSIYMANIALSPDYLRSSLHRHDTMFFSKMSHSADNTACRLKPLAATATMQSTHDSRNQWSQWPCLHGARFAAKMFLQMTKYLLKLNEIWNVNSQGHALKYMNLSNQNIYLPSLGLAFNTGLTTTATVGQSVANWQKFFKLSFTKSLGAGWILNQF